MRLGGQRLGVLPLREPPAPRPPRDSLDLGGVQHLAALGGEVADRLVSLVLVFARKLYLTPH